MTLSCLAPWVPFLVSDSNPNDGSYRRSAASCIRGEAALESNGRLRSEVLTPNALIGARYSGSDCQFPLGQI